VSPDGKFVAVLGDSSDLCSTDTDRCISIGPIQIRGYVKFLQNLKAQRCIGVSDTDTQIRIGYVIRGHVEVSGLQSLSLNSLGIMRLTIYVRQKQALMIPYPPLMALVKYRRC